MLGGHPTEMASGFISMVLTQFDNPPMLLVQVFLDSQWSEGRLLYGACILWGVLKRQAVFSECRSYRYGLWRVWDESKPTAMFICLNPSTADEVDDDPTISRCIGFAREWGYGGICVGNLFAFRETDRCKLKLCRHPVGPNNDKWLQRMSRESDIVVSAWGNDDSFMWRASKVKALIPELYCIEVNKTGEPRHPLYAKQASEPKPMFN